MAIQTCTLGRSRLSLGGGGGLNTARKLSAVAAVALLIVPMMLMFSGVLTGDDTVEAVDDGAREITYHYSASGESVTLTYYGTAVAEYNPEYWNNNTVGEAEDGVSINAWKGDYETKDVTVKINISWKVAGLPSSDRHSIITFPWNIDSESFSSSINRISLNSGTSDQLRIDRYGWDTSGNVTLTFLNAEVVQRSCAKRSKRKRS